MRWYRQAVEQGNASAQNNLGNMYRQGEGVPADAVGAYAWFSIAAAQGNEDAKEWKRKVTDQMTRDQIAEGQELSQEYWKTYGLPPLVLMPLQ